MFFIKLYATILCINKPELDNVHLEDNKLDEEILFNKFLTNKTSMSQKFNNTINMRASVVTNLHLDIMYTCNILYEELKKNLIKHLNYLGYNNVINIDAILYKSFTLFQKDWIKFQDFSNSQLNSFFLTLYEKIKNLKIEYNKTLNYYSNDKIVQKGRLLEPTKILKFYSDKLDKCLKHEYKNFVTLKEQLEKFLLTCIDYFHTNLLKQLWDRYFDRKYEKDFFIADAVSIANKCKIKCCSNIAFSKFQEEMYTCIINNLIS